MTPTHVRPCAHSSKLQRAARPRARQSPHPQDRFQPGCARTRSPLSRSVLPRVSPALGAAEGHQRRRSIRSGMASWPQGRQGSLTSGERGSLEPGTAVANVPSPGGPLAVLCSFERKGLCSTLGQQEVATACEHMWKRKSCCAAWCGYYGTDYAVCMIPQTLAVM